MPQAQRLLVEGERIRDRQKRGMIMSAARSYLFNLVLAQRVASGSWRQLLEGEVLVDGVATGPLWGRGRAQGRDLVAALEAEVLVGWQDWCNSLEHMGLSQERRALVLQPVNLSWQWQGDNLVLGFGLGKGDFATSILREICQLQASVNDAVT